MTSTTEPRIENSGTGTPVETSYEAAQARRATPTGPKPDDPPPASAATGKAPDDNSRSALPVMVILFLVVGLILRLFNFGKSEPPRSTTTAGASGGFDAVFDAQQRIAESQMRAQQAREHIQRGW